MTEDHVGACCGAPLKRGVVVAGSPFAADAGAELLRAGGNAADAAVAATLAMCVVDPANASILGRAQILWRDAEGNFAAIDGASAVPTDMSGFGMEMRGNGGLALAGIPGLPQALERLHARHGRLTLAQIVEPAAKLAENGFSPPAHLRSVWALRMSALRAGDARPYCVKGAAKPGGSAFFKHPRLASLLRDFGQNGAQSIIRGATAKALVDGVQQRGGYWSMAALAANDAREGEFIHGEFRGHTVTTLGRQGWGHSLLEMLMILDTFPKFGDSMSAQEARILLLTIRAAFADRPQRLGSLEPKPDGLALERLVSAAFIRERAARIREELAAAPKAGRVFTGAPVPEEEDQDTTHLSVIDNEGASVALTCSIGPHFGLRVTEPSFGLLPAKSYRMETDPVPGARDVTEMTPVIVSRAGKPVLVLGGAGSERIPGAVVQVIVNVLDRKLGLEAAVRLARVNFKGERPRVHADIGDDIISDLVAHGLAPEISDRGHENHLGIVHAAAIDATGKIMGAADDAWDGKVAYACSQGA